MELEEIERENFNESPAKHKIHQYFPVQNKLHYTVYSMCILFLVATV